MRSSRQHARHKRPAVEAAGPADGALTLASLPTELLVAVVAHLPEPEDLALVDCTARLFHAPAHTAGGEYQSVVEQALRLRAAERNIEVPPSLPFGECSWTQKLCWDERRRRAGVPSVVAAANFHCAFVDAEGRLLTCGTEEREEDGESTPGLLGHGAEARVAPAPLEVRAAAGVRWHCVAAHFTRTLAVSESGRLYAFGARGDPALGRVDAALGLPRPVLGLSRMRVVAVSAGLQHSLALAECGAAFAWGRGDDGRLGHGRAGDEHAPRRIEAMRGVRVRAISAGHAHSLFATAAGEAFACGASSSGALGLSVRRDTASSGSGDSDCGEDEEDEEDGGASALGFAPEHLLGEATASFPAAPSAGVLRPTRVDALPADVVGVAAGAEHSLFVTAAGELYACGEGSCGRLGIGGDRSAQLPTRVSGLRAVRIVAAAAAVEHSLCVDAAGGVWSFGGGDSGKLGHGTDEDVDVPRRIEALRSERIVSVSAGGSADGISLAVSADGRIFGWGRGNDETLGLRLEGCKEQDQLVPLAYPPPLRAPRLSHPRPRTPAPPRATISAASGNASGAAWPARGATASTTCARTKGQAGAQRTTRAAAAAAVAAVAQIRAAS